VASPGEYRAKLERVRAAALEAGRDPAAITPALHKFIAVAGTEREARSMLRTKLARFAALASAPAAEWRRLGVEHPFGESFRGYVDFVPERYDRSTLERAIAAVPPELVGRGFVVGTLPQVVERLRAYGAAGARHVVLSLSSALFSRRAALFGQLAVPAIARRLRRGV
jgi:phthiodiolone/phenolphthiodiolone dimycocerosates ketoreductase